MNVRNLIERYNAAWNAQDLDAIHALHHPDVVFHNHTADERAEGAKAVRAQKRLGRLLEKSRLAVFELTARDLRTLRCLPVRAKLRGLVREEARHGRDVALHALEVHDERRRVDLGHAHFRMLACPP